MQEVLTSTENRDRRLGGALALQPLSLVQVSRDPVACYLGSLSRSGRITMRDRLHLVARLFGYQDAHSFPWAEVRYEHALAVRAYFTDLGRAPETINSTLSAVFGVAKQAWLLGVLSGEEYLRLREVKRVRGERLPAGRLVDGEEVRAIFDACKRDPNRHLGSRDAALLALMFGAGLRRSEPGRLDLHSYNPARGELRMIGKGNKERLLFLAPGVRAALDDWLMVRGDTPGPLVLRVCRYGCLVRPYKATTPYMVDDAVRRRAAEAGLKEHVSTHDARRSFITNLLERGVDILTVQELAGHSDPKTTKKYDRRRDAVKRAAAEKVDLPY